MLLPCNFIQRMSFKNVIFLKGRLSFIELLGGIVRLEIML